MYVFKNIIFHLVRWAGRQQTQYGSWLAAPCRYSTDKGVLAGHEEDTSLVNVCVPAAYARGCPCVQGCCQLIRISNRLTAW